METYMDFSVHGLILYALGLILRKLNHLDEKESRFDVIMRSFYFIAALILAIASYFK
jgi:hypothetical protein